MSDEPRNPTLETLLGLVIEQALESFQVMVPARIVSYDDAKQSASVQPLIRKAYLNETEDRVAELLPEIHDVPVAHYGSAKGRITVPVEAGDLGRLVFVSLSIARWKLTGGVVDPGDDRRHDYNDCVFEPGLHSLNAPPTTAPTDAIVLHAGTAKKVKVGGPTGTEPTVMGTTYRGAEDTMLTAIAAAMTAAATAFTALGQVAAATAATAATTAITTFQSSAAAYLTQKAEVK